MTGCFTFVGTSTYYLPALIYLLLPVFTRVAKVEREGEAIASRQAQSQIAFDQDKMNDSLMMPPPPPRLPKRQKTASSLDDAVVTIAAADEPTHPDWISIPPPQRRSTAAGGRERQRIF